ncbi:MAG: hypothetical protein K8E66_05880, partial [Phycisphaerales bacterium]|nr:hypothetical protein [Phycisphaerales bacterium]
MSGLDLPLPGLPPRDPAGHKGTFGTVTVVGGCAMEASRMFGAPALAARAALRSGCGLATLLVPAPVLDRTIALTPSATGRALPVDENGDVVAHAAAAVFDEAVESAGAIVIGPGFGPGDGARSIVLRAMFQAETPVVLDADGLNLLAGLIDFARDSHAAAVLTPHPG